MRLLTKAADAIAEALVDHCSGGAPDGDWGDCCERHDRAYEFGSRWRLDRWLASNVVLGWCIATKPSSTAASAVGRGILGLVYTLATSTAGIGWWMASKPIAKRVKSWAKVRIVKAKVRRAKRRWQR